jgi:hypothetical protein
MQIILKVSVLLFFSAILFSCGLGKKRDVVIKSKDGEVTVNNIVEAGQQVKDAIKDADQKRKERRERGDTLAMNYKDLQNMLPTIAGYEKKGDPGGESVTMPGLGSFSKAEQRYESGDKRIEVELIDYNQSTLGYTTATGMFGMNIQLENDREKSGSFETGMKDVKGYEQVYKDGSKASVTYAIADRFILTVKSRGSSDVDMLKRIVKTMRIEELATK